MTPTFKEIFLKYCYHAERASDFFIKSFKFPPNSLEWKICRLQNELEHKKADVFIKKMNQCVKEEYGRL